MDRRSFAVSVATYVFGLISNILGLLALFLDSSSRTSGLSDVATLKDGAMVELVPGQPGRPRVYRYAGSGGIVLGGGAGVGFRPA